ncbi:MAG: thioredoxin family protein [Bacteroidota bacterium]
MKTALLFLFLLPLAGYHSESNLWKADLGEAIESAKADDKQILMVFSGSDWCRPCIKLRQEILDHSSFQAFAEHELVLLEVDFPRARKNRLPAEQTAKNEALAERYNPQGAFPRMVLLEADQTVLGQIQYLSDDPADLIQQIKAILP